MKKNTFKAAWWLPNSHLQTIWPVLINLKPIKLNLSRERIELPDGDFIDIDWLNKDKKTPIVFVLHGFEGSIDSHYAKRILNDIGHQDWRAAFMYFRGCSGEPNRLNRSYHSGDTEDVDYIVKLIKEREPSQPIAAVGYSLGGNVLLKWLGETGKENPLSAAIAVSVPFELHKAAAHIQNGFSRFYQWYLLRCVRDRLVHKFEKEPAGLDLDLISEANTIRDFDNAYTAPLHGFQNADDYYSRSSSRQYLKNISVPTLILHAKDDPFMSQDVIPNPDELSSSITLEITEQGGHVGFVGGKYPWQPEFWLEKRIIDFFSDNFINKK